MAISFSAEGHIAAAKAVRRNAASREHAQIELYIQKSNALVICAHLAAAGRGNLHLDGFAWSSIYPDWSSIDEQLEHLELREVAAPSIALTR